jgi:GTP-binding protein
MVMSDIPIVAIVGRPNVGKSSLFNCLAGKRIAIVDALPGVTRDRISTIIDYEGRLFDLMDTGGVGIVDRDDLGADIAAQIEIALTSADLILFVVDAREGRMPLDREVAEKLRVLKKPVIIVANKAERQRDVHQIGEFAALGFGEPLPVSAKLPLNRGELLERIVERLPQEHAPRARAEGALKLAIVGKRNAGKSTLINHLVGEERLITSSKPGTTRDAIDVPFTRKGTKYLAIDTAGVRRKRSIQDSVEFYGFARTERSVRRADVVLLLFDATTEISKVDKKIASFIRAQFKPCILVVNKWDLAGDIDPKKYRSYMDAHLRGFSFAPISLVSAKAGLNVDDTLALAGELDRQAQVRISTGKLNAFIEATKARKGPTAKKHKRPKIYFATQVGIGPPTFVVFVNSPELFSRDYGRYMENALRAAFDFSEIPLRIFFRKSGPDNPYVSKKK